MKRIYKFFYYLSLFFILPISMIMIIKEWFIFKRNIKIMQTVINNNQSFFQYLDKWGFIVDWVGRLYSVQIIPKEIRDYTEDELYDIVMRSIVTSLQHILNENILLDVCGITTYKKTESIYILNITSSNEPQLKHKLKWFITSLIFNLIIFITYLIIF